jgi:hypothetical protein
LGTPSDGHARFSDGPGARRPAHERGRTPVTRTHPPCTASRVSALGIGRNLSGPRYTARPRLEFFPFIYLVYFCGLWRAAWALCPSLFCALFYQHPSFDPFLSATHLVDHTERMPLEHPVSRTSAIHLDPSTYFFSPVRYGSLRHGAAPDRCFHWKSRSCAVDEPCCEPPVHPAGSSDVRSPACPPTMTSTTDRCRLPVLREPHSGPECPPDHLLPH